MCTGKHQTIKKPPKQTDLRWGLRLFQQYATESVFFDIAHCSGVETTVNVHDFTADTRGQVRA